MDAVESLLKRLRQKGIADESVLQALRRVKRHEFLAPSQRGSAYEDRPLPIGEGQTISQPYVVAFMTMLLDVAAEDRVLEIGTGSGYQTAVLSCLAAEVYTVEAFSGLAAAAEERLNRLGFGPIYFRVGNGRLGWPEAAPFAGILVTAAASEIPEPLVEQLVLGGRLIIPVGDPHREQVLQRVTKTQTGRRVEDHGWVRFVPLLEPEREGDCG